MPGPRLACGRPRLFVSDPLPKHAPLSAAPVGCRELGPNSFGSTFCGPQPAVRRKFVRGRFARGHGSGLGLAIVSRIVADHHGSFTLESELRAGTVATVGLPVAADEA